MIRNNLFAKCETFIVRDENNNVLLKTIVNTSEHAETIKHWFTTKGYKICCTGSNDQGITWTMNVSKRRTQKSLDLHIIYQDIIKLSPRQRELLLGWLTEKMRCLNNINDTDKTLRYLDENIESFSWNYHINPFTFRKELIHFLRKFR